MNEQQLQIVEPAEWLEDEYLAFLEECFLVDQEMCLGKKRELVAGGFPLFVQKCREDAAGRSLEEGWVQQTNYWLVRGDRLLGVCGLRHRLTPMLEQHGGHIGYRVRPSERGKGYATRMLGMVLDKARAMGLARVMLTCEKGNAASARVIQKNGGRFECEYWWEEGGRRLLVQRYWIEL